MSSDTMTKDFKWHHVKRHPLNLCCVVYSLCPSGWSFLAKSEVNLSGAETWSTPVLHNSAQGTPSLLRTSESHPLPTPPPPHSFHVQTCMHWAKNTTYLRIIFKDIGTSFTWSCKAQCVYAHPCRWDTAPRVWSLSLLLNILNTQFWRFTTVSCCCDLEMWPWSLTVVWLGNAQ